MSDPNPRLEAYRETCRIVARELAPRIAIVGAVAILVARVIAPAQAFTWAAILALFLAVEAALYRRLVPDAATRITPTAMATLGAASLSCNFIAVFPLIVFLGPSTPALHFAASAYMAGLLINLIINNSAHPAIFAFATGPSAVAYVSAGVWISWRANDPTAAITAVAFVGAAFIAYVALARTMRGHREAVAAAQRERETALRASDAKSEFLAKMGHELKTPLNGMLGMAQAMGADNLTPAQKDRLQIIVNAGDQLLAILNDVLDHARIESGALSLNPAPAQLSAIIARAAGPFRQTAQRKGVVFSVDISNLVADSVTVDAARLEQCLAHVVSNAVKFTEKGGVFIAARSHADGAGNVRITIVVRDTGAGMTEEERARAFDAFEQADNSIRRRHGGAGLGLALSRSLMRAMGGEIVADSAPGRGSEFVLELTAPAASLSSAPESAAASPSGSRPSILVVEDNLVNFQVVKSILENHTRAIAHAENGAAALARLDAERFDVIFMDMHMPVMDGLSATREIRAAKADWSQTPIIFVTAAASAEDEGAAFASGADAFIAKPVKAATLLRALSAAAQKAA